MAATTAGLDGLYAAIEAEKIQAIAGKPAWLSNESSQDHLEHKRAINHIRELHLGGLTKQFIEPDTMEAIATSKALKGEKTVAEQLSEFGAVITQLMQLVKAGGVTPPVTIEGYPSPTPRTPG